jgi:hypothetical protein
MTRPRARTPSPEGRGSRARQRHRNRDRWGAVVVVILAAVAGLIAAHYGTHHAWEQPRVSQTTVQQGSP